MLEHEALQIAVKIAGGQTALARKLSEITGDKITQAHVWNWLNVSRRAPPERAIAIEAAVDSRITRHDLRPDLYPEKSPPSFAEAGGEAPKSEAKNTEAAAPDRGEAA